MLGETPIWLPLRGAVAWIDAIRRRVRMYDVRTGQVRSITVDLPAPLGGIVRGPDDNSLILAGPGMIGSLDLVSSRFSPMVPIDDERHDIVCNDAKVDARGDLWIGTCERAEREPRGALYRIARGGRVELFDAGFVVPNGPAFSPDGSTAYVSDTMAGRILAYALDARGLQAGPRRVFADLSPTGGLPDGLTVDQEGCLWCGLWTGGGIARFAPDGRFLGKLALPATNVTSLVFGGEDLRDLYVTSARTALSRKALASERHAGSLFRVRVATRGIAEPPWSGISSPRSAPD